MKSRSESEEETFRKLLKQTVDRCLNDQGNSEDAKGLANVVVSLLYERDKLVAAMRKDRKIIKDFEKMIKGRKLF